MRRRHFAYAALAVLASTGGVLADPVPLKDTVPHITTTGEASAEVVPDQADIQLGIVNERPTADAAAQETATGAAAVIDEIKRQGTDARDIKTSFDLAAQYDEEHNEHGTVTKRTFRGYRSEEQVTVRLRDVAKAGSLARAFIAKGANAFKGIDFSYSKEESKREELKAKAIRNALARAKIYTDTIGLRLGRVLQIGDESGGGEADMPSRRVGYKMAVAIPTEPGVQRIEESITVIWEIEGKAQ